MTENTSGADTSYEQALKSTGIVGGAQFLTILITVVKTKIVALLLGPAGVGVRLQMMIFLEIGGI